MSVTDSVLSLCKKRSENNQVSAAAGQKFLRSTDVKGALDLITSILNNGDYKSRNECGQFCDLASKFEEAAPKYPATVITGRDNWDVGYGINGKYFTFSIEKWHNSPTVIFSVLADESSVYFKFKQFVKKYNHQYFQDKDFTTEVMTFLFDCFDQV